MEKKNGTGRKMQRAEKWSRRIEMKNGADRKMEQK
jgi:hypothetical protein